MTAETIPKYGMSHLIKYTIKCGNTGAFERLRTGKTAGHFPLKGGAGGDSREYDFSHNDQAAEGYSRSR